MYPLSLHKVLVALIALTPVLVSSQLTIPRRSLGFVYRTSNATRSSLVTLTVYMDLTCDDSQVAYPTLLHLADELKDRNFELVLRSFPLPYHRNSHIITQAVHVVNDIAGSASVFPFITAVYSNLGSLTTYGTRDKTDEQVLDILAPIVKSTSGISSDQLTKELSKGTYDSASRLDFKYGCTRAVYGTPTFMLNDVVVDATPSTNINQWMSVILPLL